VPVDEKGAPEGARVQREGSAPLPGVYAALPAAGAGDGAVVDV
jgi:hypothetical protein